MKSFLKKVLKVVLVLFVLAVLGGVALWLREEHYGPWATGGPDRAILGATFGMSEQEVARATKQNLMWCFQAERQIHDSDGTTPFDITVNCDSKYQVDREDFERTQYRFVNTIELFGSPCWLSLDFFDDRLRFMEAHFQPYTEASKLVETVHAELLASGYIFQGREPSKEVPGAYRNNYLRKPVGAIFWVNLTDPKKPALSLYLHDEDMNEALKREKAERNKRVF